MPFRPYHVLPVRKVMKDVADVRIPGTAAETCRREIDGLLGRDDITEKDKQALLGGNLRRLYGLPS